MAKVIVDKKGRKITLRNPAEKGEKYAFELKNGYNASTGKSLTREQRAYRSGYLDSRKDGARAWKANKRKKQARRPRKK